MKKTALFIPLSILSTSLLLVGCGGGGGSSVRVAAVPVAPTTIRDNSPVTFDTITNEIDVTAIASIATGAVDRGVSETSTARLTYDASGNLSKLVITTPNSSPGSSVSWDVATDTRQAVVGLADHVALTDAATTYNVLAIDPKSSAFDYQTFGVWKPGAGVSAGAIGVLSAGLKTVGASVPTTGNVTFTGKLLGVYISPAGQGRFVTGETAINSDFAARTIGFSTSNTKLDGTTLTPNLDIATTALTYTGANSFSGVVTATGAGAGLSGTANGAFYGPNAEEVGGVFTVKASSGIEFYTGSFGAQ
ncbi:transferrin-binding protein-like solute binding protein [Neptunomonas japonica]|uniref:transferrin-binding protein-like solute binding protein n=1 Tax=Neptunomonas japonica TaxID=417574 RepID=UPI000416ED0F|nr:transferrin-binding protein-like solute binding protein [Neptunomonas japonica]